MLGLASLIVMPSDAPRLKIARTQGVRRARCISTTGCSEDRDAIAGRIAAERRAALVHPFDDPDVIAGQGTAGLEMMEQAARARRACPTPCWCRARAAASPRGIALAVKAARPRAQVYAVEPAGFDDLARSLASGRRERNAKLSGSICDALLAPSPGEITFEIAAPRCWRAASWSATTRCARRSASPITS